MSGSKVPAVRTCKERPRKRRRCLGLRYARGRRVVEHTKSVAPGCARAPAPALAARVRAPSVRHEHHVGNGEISAVREGDEGTGGPELFAAPGRAPVKLQVRGAMMPDDLDARPVDPS